MLTQLVTSVKELNYSIKRIFRVMKDPEGSTYFPEEERKSNLRMWGDNLLWLAKHGEANIYYFVYGLDRKKAVDENELIAYNKLLKYRNHRNSELDGKHYNYVCMLRDKFVFGQFLTSLQFATPKNIALLDQNGVTWLSTMTTEPLTALTKDAETIVNGFCKKVFGSQGSGAFPLYLKDGKLYNKDAEITVDQLKEKLKGQYLFQERIVQHPKMAGLHPASVNTIRMITFNNGGKVDVLSAVIRIGARGKNVDNWASGGIIVAIDIQTGKLAKEGKFKVAYGGRATQHPDTGIIFEDFEIPFFKESIELTCRLHSYFYGIHSIGWDIGITANGPVFIEGNDGWDAAIHMALENNFKSRFLQLFPQQNLNTAL